MWWAVGDAGPRVAQWPWRGAKVFLSLTAAIREGLICPYEILPWVRALRTAGPRVYCG